MTMSSKAALTTPVDPAKDQSQQPVEFCNR
jgi:hypothetical protein